MKKKNSQKGKTDFPKLAKLKDPEIDTSDIAELDEKFFKNAVWTIRRPKKMVSIRLDEEVLAWFRSQGKGYQTMINEILKMYIRAKAA